MAKRPVTFDTNNERDKEILDDIAIYMKKMQIRYRIDAVRNLCEMALKIEKITGREDEQKRG